MMKYLLACCAVLAGALCPADPVEDEVVQATGVASTYRGAVNEALVAALERHDGITVSATELASASESNEAESGRTNGVLDERTKLKMNDSIAKSMLKWAKGKIKTYEVLSDRVENGKYRVEVAVHFVGKYVCGLPEENRRRMVVANFRAANGDTFSWCGRKESTAMWASAVADKLNERLTQARKFTMIDRKFDMEVQDEIARLSDKNAAKGDVVRLGQRLGTDYMLVGDVKFSDVLPPAVNPITGQTMEMAPQKFAEVSYRVVLAPTGQLKWADSVVVGSGDVAASDILSFVSATADLAACRIADAVMANLLPFEIVGRNAAGEVIVGEGGKSLAVGERLTVFALGEVVRDSRTGEELDQVEEPVGAVEIVRVTPKLSYARIIEGDAAKVVAGARLRRPQVVVQPESAPVSQPLNTTVRGAGNGGVVTPF